MSFFQTTSQFFFKYCIITPLQFFSPTSCTLDKKISQSTNFKTFQCSGDVQVIPHVIYETTSLFPSRFASIFSLMTQNYSILFYLKHNIVWSKGPHWSANFETFERWVKFEKFFMSFFKAPVSSLSKFASFFSVMAHDSSVIF